jgi:chemotaxis signal transduction protein
VIRGAREMSEPEASEARMLTFEAAGGLFALSIGEILEVGETSEIASIPTVLRSCGGVMNHRGDALPVLSLHVLLGGEVALESALGIGSVPQGTPLLVLARDDDHAPKLGLPVDSVLGFVSAPTESEKCEGVVRERFCLEGREVVVIDSRQLMARATSVIEGECAAA